jgi:DNA primase
MSQWIDFKALRESLDFAAVLRHYKVELKQKKGDQYQMPCPLPGHQGTRRSPSFSANLERRIFQCFGCGARGNVLDFAVIMEGKNPGNMQQVRDVALMLHERFRSRQPSPERNKALPSRPRPAPAQKEAATPRAAKTVVNPPLDFELRDLDQNHPYLYERGFTRETIERFGLGYCSRGRFARRIAIPLHDLAGKLVGYAGRLTNDAEASDKIPKYLFPCDRLRNDIVHEFRKDILLYNAHAITKHVSDLIVVQGFPAVWWLWQAGLFNIVSLMGSSCSPEQASCIVKLVEPRYANAPGSGGTVWILTSGDDAGRCCASSIFESIAPARRVRWGRLKEKQQPTDLSPQQVLSVLEMA